MNDREIAGLIRTARQCREGHGERRRVHGVAKRSRNRGSRDERLVTDDERSFRLGLHTRGGGQNSESNEKLLHGLSFSVENSMIYEIAWKATNQRAEIVRGGSRIIVSRAEGRRGCPSTQTQS